ncbi:hypothetical protein ABKV19_026240 [Rosa sericea]
MAQVDDYLRKQAAELLQAMNGGYYKEDNIPCQIEEGLFLGSFGAANDEEELNRLNITHILTVGTSKLLFLLLFFFPNAIFTPLVSGAMTALLRNLDHCISSYSSVIRKSEIEDAEECFKLFSLEEAAKFDEVTLANVNNFKSAQKASHLMQSTKNI